MWKSAGFWQIFIHLCAGMISKHQVTQLWDRNRALSHTFSTIFHVRDNTCYLELIHPTEDQWDHNRRSLVKANPILYHPLAVSPPQSINALFSLLVHLVMIKCQCLTVIFSSWALKDFSKSSCFFRRASTLSRESPRSSFSRNAWSKGTNICLCFHTQLL